MYYVNISISMSMNINMSINMRIVMIININKFRHYIINSNIKISMILQGLFDLIYWTVAIVLPLVESLRQLAHCDEEKKDSITLYWAIMAVLQLTVFPFLSVTVGYYTPMVNTILHLAMVVFILVLGGSQKVSKQMDVHLPKLKQ